MHIHRVNQSLIKKQRQVSGYRSLPTSEAETTRNPHDTELIPFIKINSK